MVKVYTRTGDDGTTHCFKSGRISKDDCLLEAIGTVDELNSQVGLLVAHLATCTDIEDSEKNEIRSLQDRLFDVGGALATFSAEKQFAELLARLDESLLEKQIDRMDSVLPEIKQFILPGGSQCAALAHVCRSVCRRAERNVVAVFQSHQQESSRVAEGLARLMKYMNRLSDYLFVLARYLNLQASHSETFWSSGQQDQ